MGIIPNQNPLPLDIAVIILQLLTRSIILVAFLWFLKKISRWYMIFNGDEYNTWWWFIDNQLQKNDKYFVVTMMLIDNKWFMIDYRK